jgi:MFS family permease
LKSSSKILNVLGLGTALSLLGDSTLYTVLPDPANAAIAGVTLSAVGFILGANRLTRMATNPLAGALLDRFPRRPILIAAMLVGSLCTLIYAVFSGLLAFIIGRVLWGFAWSGIWIGGNTIILDISTPENRGRLSGYYQSWFFIGVGASALLAGLFTDLFGFRGGLFVSAALNAIAILLWLFMLPETRAPIMQMQNGQAEKFTDLDWPTILFAALPTFGMRFVYAGVIASTSIIWLSKLFGNDGFSFTDSALPIATITGGFVALRTITSMLSGPLSGDLSDRLGRRWGVIAGLLVLGGSGMWLMGVDRIWIAILGGFVAAIPGGGIQALIPALIGDRINAQQESRALGLVYTFGDLGSAIGPVAALGLLDTLGLTSIYRLCSVILFVLALTTLPRLRGEFTPSALNSPDHLPDN